MLLSFHCLLFECPIRGATIGGLAIQSLNVGLSFRFAEPTAPSVQNERFSNWVNCLAAQCFPTRSSSIPGEMLETVLALGFRLSESNFRKCGQRMDEANVGSSD